MSMVVWPHRIHPMLGSIVAEPVMMAAPAREAKPSKAKTPEAGRAEGSAAAKRTYRIVMAGGGTGGHLYPGLAVAEALRAVLGEAVELIWAATPRPVDQRLLGKFGGAYVQQPVQPLVKSVGRLWGFWRGWSQSCAYWRAEFAGRRPDAVVALGGYAAGPAAYVASKLGVPVVLLNPDALPGLANRFLLKRADVVVTQWALGASYQAVLRGRAMPLGCPIRADLLNRSREEAASRLGVDAARRTLVVTGASLGAKTINDAMLKLLEDAEFRIPFEASLAGWQVIHLAGAEQAGEVKAAYAKHAGVRVKVLDYCDDMASVWALADLAIARAGASTCAELTACGVPSILLPYPYHRDMHQRANAQELARGGAAVIVDDAKDAAANAEAVKKALQPLLYDDEVRHRMAEAARVIGKPEAAANIAQEILALMDPKTR